MPSSPRLINWRRPSLARFEVQHLKVSSFRKCQSEQTRERKKLSLQILHPNIYNYRKSSTTFTFLSRIVVQRCLHLYARLLPEVRRCHYFILALCLPPSHQTHFIFGREYALHCEIQTFLHFFIICSDVLSCCCIFSSRIFFISRRLFLTDQILSKRSRGALCWKYTPG